MSKWGGISTCPGCLKTVYPMEQVFAADRKSFHKSCITCQVRGCRNELTERGLFKHEEYNFCTSCHETLYDPKNYGPSDGETIEQRKLREQREKEERERKQKEIDEMRATGKFGGDDPNNNFTFLKIAEMVEIAPSNAYCI